MRKPQARDEIMIIPDSMEAAREAAQCPDCDSDVEIVKHDDGTYEGHVAHDDTCPFWQKIK